MVVPVASIAHRSEQFLTSSRDEEGDPHMSQQDPWQTHPSYTGMSGTQDSSNRAEDDSSTFVNPLHMRSSQSFSPYGFSTETAMPPPPPGIDGPFVSLL
jgi:hypothetical protein